MPRDDQRSDTTKFPVYMILDAAELASFFRLTFWVCFHSSLALVPLSIPRAWVPDHLAAGAVLRVFLPRLHTSEVLTLTAVGDQ